jgi:hypothetical protein
MSPLPSEHPRGSPSTRAGTPAREAVDQGDGAVAVGPHSGAGDWAPPASRSVGLS